MSSAFYRSLSFGQVIQGIWDCSVYIAVGAVTHLLFGLLHPRPDYPSGRLHPYPDCHNGILHPRPDTANGIGHQRPHCSQSIWDEKLDCPNGASHQKTSVLCWGTT